MFKYILTMSENTANSFRGAWPGYLLAHTAVACTITTPHVRRQSLIRKSPYALYRIYGRHYGLNPRTACLASLPPTRLFILIDTYEHLAARKCILLQLPITTCSPSYIARHWQMLHPARYVFSTSFHCACLV